MVWASKNFMSSRIRLACPVMELFHPYKTLLENLWKKPEFFYSFFGPLSHCFHPNSPVALKPRLKLLGSYATALRLVWPEFRPNYLFLVKHLQKEPLRTHFKNVLLILDFFIPIVSLHVFCP